MQPRIRRSPSLDLPDQNESGRKRHGQKHIGRKRRGSAPNVAEHLSPNFLSRKIGGNGTLRQKRGGKPKCQSIPLQTSVVGKSITMEHPPRGLVRRRPKALTTHSVGWLGQDFATARRRETRFNRVVTMPRHLTVNVHTLCGNCSFKKIWGIRLR